MKNPYMKLWVDDYLRGTKLFTLEQKGLYMDMLLELWIEGDLPDDPKVLAKLFNVNPRTFKKIWAVIQVKFSSNSGRITHERILIERLKMLSLSEKNTISGQKGGKAKANATANATKTLERKASHIDQDQDSDLKSIKKPIVNLESKAQPETSHRKRLIKTDPKLKHEVSKLIQARKDVLDPQSMIDTPNAKKLVKDLLKLRQLPLDAEKVLGFVIQARQAGGIDNRVGYCIKIMTDSKYAVADGCLDQAKNLIRKWTEQNIDPKVKNILPDLGAS